MSSIDPQAERWLAQIREGSPPEKAAARRGLAGVFAARGMTAEAVELLVANAREGFRDAEQFQTLAQLYRQLGNEYLATSAAMEAARLREAAPGPDVAAHPPSSPWSDGYAAPPPSPPPSRGQGYTSPSPPPRSRGQGYVPPPPGRADGSPQGAPPGQSSYPRPSAPPPPQGGGNDRLLGVSLTGPIRFGLWAMVAVLAVAGLALLATSIGTGILYVLSAAAFGLALLGSGGPRQSLRVPGGPLGDGLLLFVGLATFLAGGALLPRGPLVPAGATSAAAPTGTIYAGTPTPGSAKPTTAAASPSNAGQPRDRPGAGPDTTGQRFIAAAGPDGVRLRVTPGSSRGEKLVGDGALLVPIEADRDYYGVFWRRVRAPDGDTGWVEVEQLKAAPTGPPPTFAGGVAPDDHACRSDRRFKGHVASTGALIYHRPGGRFYSRTFPDACFATEEAAKAAGFELSPQ